MAINYKPGAIALSMALTLTTAPAAEDKTYVMKLGTATINKSQHEWCKRFAAMVEKDSGGRIKGEIYPASQLGPIPREIEGVQFGAIQGYSRPAGISGRHRRTLRGGLRAGHRHRPAARSRASSPIRSSRRSCSVSAPTKASTAPRCSSRSLPRSSPTARSAIWPISRAKNSAFWQRTCSRR